MARTKIVNKNIPDTDKPEVIKGSIDPVENSNEYILNNIAAYLEFLRAEIKQIILDDNLKYSDPMEKKKIYPDFTYTQFLYLLSRLYDRVYSVNLELLCKPCIYNNYNKPFYDPDKVKTAYDVYLRLCNYYGYNCSTDPFYKMVGIEEHTIREWLSSGYSPLYKIMQENAKNDTVSRFENSPVPILRLAAGNYKYNLDKPVQEHTAQGVIESLPDLLALTDTQEKPQN